MLDKNVEAFVVHVASLTLKITIYPARKGQIVSLITKKVNVPVEYSDYVDIFSKKSAKVLTEQTGINEHVIKIEELK